MFDVAKAEALVFEALGPFSSRSGLRSFAPQFRQYVAPEGFSVPHFGQNMVSPFKRAPHFSGARFAHSICYLHFNEGILRNMRFLELSATPHAEFCGRADFVSTIGAETRALSILGRRCVLLGFRFRCLGAIVRRFRIRLDLRFLRRAIGRGAFLIACPFACLGALLVNVL